MFDPALLVFIAACTAAALTGVFFKPGQWYENLAKPPWRPPNWLFGPAWTILYAMIAISGWMVWKASSWPAVAPAMAIYGVQLLLNAGWTPLFFGLRRPDLAFYELLLLWASILATTLTFLQISQFAALLLVPYLCWVTFAGALNRSIVLRNPDLARG
ncbi:TspO/MBR family protein [Thalassobaculum sp. OXR-137]|uniref:TspO/MBR family protein n=1 Tax=Thalassobaculum sp. OXR-137 TaxID=3100173 RepID=UPI002AC8C17E|nr:TspO/MBR family protein [Thalassobaculum sp. OXR-137]WPZ36802.1 TspO/MBR family protein [Thalassobaculum sp. OXR-137]